MCSVDERPIILILADGDWPSEDRLRSAVRATQWTIAADGAFSKAKKLGIHVDCVVGDFDSLSPDDAARARAEAKVDVYPTEKDWTDLELAIDLALTYSPSRIVIYGAIGSRLDHSLAAVFLLEKILSHGVDAELVAGRETARLTSEELVLRDVRIGDRVSILPISKQAIVETTGLQYGLKEEKIDRSLSRGISNVVKSVPVQVRVTSGLVLVIHAPSKESL